MKKIASEPKEVSWVVKKKPLPKWLVKMAQDLAKPVRWSNHKPIRLGWGHRIIFVE